MRHLVNLRALWHNISLSTMTLWNCSWLFPLSNASIWSPRPNSRILTCLTCWTNTRPWTMKRLLTANRGKILQQQEKRWVRAGNRKLHKCDQAPTTWSCLRNAWERRLLPCRSDWIKRRAFFWRCTRVRKLTSRSPSLTRTICFSRYRQATIGMTSRWSKKCREGPSLSLRLIN